MPSLMDRKTQLDRAYGKGESAGLRGDEFKIPYETVDFCLAWVSGYEHGRELRARAKLA